ncbi:MAG TPA: DUF2235 domain-containing protein [Burkholderiaceae bacterium]|nr:DUF2235 domain-containing protein [Burkholderiaceae bacterium]
MTRPVRLSIITVCLPVALMVGTPGHGQPTCGPPSLGSPCALGGPALLPPNEPSLNLGAGNPIHLATGNKHQRETDLPAIAGVPGLEIVRHYNSRDHRQSAFGSGWSLSYDARLYHIGATWQIAQPDGSRILFQGGPDGPMPNRHGRLESHQSGWRWTWPNGRELRFDTHGRLIAIRLAARHALTLARHEGPESLRGAIASVTHNGGAKLTLHYLVRGGHAYVDRVGSPVGVFQYQYEPVPASSLDDGTAPTWRLVGLTRPDGMRRRYLYEPEHQAGDPLLLTGVAIVSADGRRMARTNSWAYDKTGRAIRSTQGGPDATKGHVSITYVRPPSPDRTGLTRVTDADGQRSQFITAVKGGRHVLLDAEGAGCSGCPAPGTHAQYDELGRLTEVNGTRIERDVSGAITSVAPSGMGWPALALHYQANGRRASWTSAVTGTEHTRFDAAHRPVRREFANGDVWEYDYDAHGRPVRLRESSVEATGAPSTASTPGVADAEGTAHPSGMVSPQTTTLSWRGRLLERVTHPHENEWRGYDAGQRMVRRVVERPHGSVPQRHIDTFHYDNHGRLARHDLPEGGALLYHYAPRGRLLGIDWLDRDARAHTVIATTAGRPGYRYGNGLTLTTRRTHGQDTGLAVADAKGVLLAESRRYDNLGRLAQETHTAPAAGFDETWRYAYDARGRMAGARRFTRAGAVSARGNPNPTDVITGKSGDNANRPPPSRSMASDPSIWYAWRDDGSLAARRDGGRTQRPTIARDPSGLPRAVGDIVLEYGPNRRLRRAARGASTLATYRHNAFGQRITAESTLARTDYFYLDNKVVAEAARPVPRTQPSGRATAGTTAPDPPTITRRYIYAGDVLVGLIDHPLDQSATVGTLYAVHTDLLGAPRAVTDASQAIRWLAAYTPTGEARRVAGDLTLDVRLPGQMFDAATGWHDNLLRTYAPALGQYLEPDPLGPVPGNQAFGYAAQRPRRYTDPLGLLLFAFDGTRNSPVTQSNVWKMARQYLDGPVFYQAGPGTPANLDWDAVTARSAPDILAAQWDALLQTLARPATRNDTIPIDIIGFSRGAALARHFANQIAGNTRDGYFSYTDAERGLITACVDLRFMGLFDTVAQFGLLGSQNANYDLTIASAWEWVAQAVALQERRRFFPLVSITGQGNTIEAPFIGAHADIGGGVSTDATGQATSRGDLSDVTLNWMLWQARAATARFAPPTSEDGEITDPILHDERLPSSRSLDDGDRRVDGPDGKQVVDRQDDLARLGRAPRAATEALITRTDNWRYLDIAEVGTVDMDGYARWLHDELGWQALPA